MQWEDVRSEHHGSSFTHHPCISYDDVGVVVRGMIYQRQGTREGYPYHGREPLVHGRGTPRGYPAGEGSLWQIRDIIKESTINIEDYICYSNPVFYVTRYNLLLVIKSCFSIQPPIHLSPWQHSRSAQEGL